MLKLTSTMLGLGLALAATPAIATKDESPKEVATELGTEFATSFFKGEPQLALDILHPALNKVGVQPNIRRSGRDGVLALTPGTLEIFAKQHNADRHLDPKTAQIKVDLIDSYPSVVLFRLKAAEDWFDYYLATKINGEWKLVNCVFGPVANLENPKAAEDEVAATLAAKVYAQALVARDFAAIKNATHLDFARRSLSKQKPARLLQENHETLALDAKSFKFASKNPDVTLLGTTQSTAAARLSIGNHTEWLFMLKLDGQWRPVNSFWQINEKRSG